MTSQQATFSPRPSRYPSRVSHFSLPLSSVRRPVFHAKRDREPETQRYSVWSRSCGASVALIAGGLDSVVTAPIIRT